MSVLLETTLGEIVVDLFTDDCPKACLNFLKLCKLKFFNGLLFHNVQRNFMIQSGDPTSTGRGATSLFSILDPKRPSPYFEDEIRPHLRHNKAGTLSMASRGPNTNASQWFITAADGLTSLDDHFTVFGRVAEGLDVVLRIADVLVDSSGRPLQNVRVRHTIVLEDPFADPPGLQPPDSSPLRAVGGDDRLEADEEIGDDAAEETEEARMEREERVKDAEAKSRAKVLEMVQDLPFAEVKPPDNVLFVCKLNPVTSEEGLNVIFSRFGRVVSVEVIRDYETGQSLCYAFVEFEEPEQAQEAYTKMDGVLIDDRRIHVDFSQSVSRQGFLANFKNRGGKWVPVGPDPLSRAQEQLGGRGRGRGRADAGRGGRADIMWNRAAPVTGTKGYDLLVESDNKAEAREGDGKGKHERREENTAAPKRGKDDDRRHHRNRDDESASPPREKRRESSADRHHSSRHSHRHHRHGSRDRSSSRHDSRK